MVTFPQCVFHQYVLKELNIWDTNNVQNQYIFRIHVTPTGEMVNTLIGTVNFMLASIIFQ